MGVLSESQILELLAKKELIIESIVPGQPFDPKKQVTGDSIDLRLGNTGWVIKNSVTQIDTLFENDIEDCFEKIEIPIGGYAVCPGRVLFTSTLEVVCLATSRYIGRVCGRTTFARYGLSIHCTQPKFPPGISWTFPLQLVNHNSIPVLVYPSSYIAQLQIETVTGEAVSYSGSFDREIDQHLPKINERELEPIKDASSIRLVRGAFTEQMQRVRKIVDDFEKAESKRIQQRSNSNGFHEGYDHAEIKATLIQRTKEAKIGETIDLEIEIVNAGKAPALLVKIQEIVPESFGIKSIGNSYRLENHSVNMKGKKLDSLKTEEIKLTVMPKTTGTFTVRPRILYLDEEGKYKCHEPDSISITVKEIGIKGWLTGGK